MDKVFIIANNTHMSGALSDAALDMFTLKLYYART